jgi:hypothetical protein
MTDKLKTLRVAVADYALLSDVASLYGVETKRVNEAVKNNPDKFPRGYIITINKKSKITVKMVLGIHIRNSLPSCF